MWYNDYLTQLRSHISRHGVKLPVDFTVSQDNIFPQQLELDLFLYFNKIAQQVDGRFVPSITGTDATVKSIFSERVNKEYEKEWLERKVALTTQPEDAGKLPEAQNLFTSTEDLKRRVEEFNAKLGIYPMPEEVHPKVKLSEVYSHSDSVDVEDWSDSDEVDEDEGWSDVDDEEEEVVVQKSGIWSDEDEEDEDEGWSDVEEPETTDDSDEGWSDEDEGWSDVDEVEDNTSSDAEDDDDDEGWVDEDEDSDSESSDDDQLGIVENDLDDDEGWEDEPDDDGWAIPSDYDEPEPDDDEGWEDEPSDSTFFDAEIIDKDGGWDVETSDDDSDELSEVETDEDDEGWVDEDSSEEIDEDEGWEDEDSSEDEDEGWEDVDSSEDDEESWVDEDDEDSWVDEDSSSDDEESWSEVVDDDEDGWEDAPEDLVASQTPSAPPKSSSVQSQSGSEKRPPQVKEFSFEQRTADTIVGGFNKLFGRK